MDFDGALGKYIVGIGIWTQSPHNHQQANLPQHVRFCSYKLAFDFTNNEVEYEALIIGFKILKRLGSHIISMYGDSKLVIKKFKGEYQAHHPRMKQYSNVVLDILRIFPEYTLSVVPRTQNLMADSLATTASNFKIPIFSNKKFEIHVKHRPSVPNNL